MTFKRLAMMRISLIGCRMDQAPRRLVDCFEGMFPVNANGMAARNELMRRFNTEVEP
jgi:hypothetical protein